MTLYVIGSFFPALAARDRVKVKMKYGANGVRNFYTVLYARRHVLYVPHYYDLNELLMHKNDCRF